MAKILGNSLPTQILELLTGKDLPSKKEKVIQIVTIDADGRPHPGMSSYHEMFAKDAGNIRFAVWQKSSAAENMRRNGKAALILVDKGLTYYVKGQAKEFREKMNSEAASCIFNLAVEQVVEDIEPVAPITSGITFKFPGMPQFEERQRKLFAELSST